MAIECRDGFRASGQEPEADMAVGADQDHATRRDACADGIDIGIVRDLRADVTELSAARQIDVRVRGRGYRAVLTPDLEAGGYTIEVPELSGCITEADTLPEARRMTREAIEAWLDADSPQLAHRRAHAR